MGPKPENPGSPGFFSARNVVWICQSPVLLYQPLVGRPGRLVDWKKSAAGFKAVLWGKPKHMKPFAFVLLSLLPFCLFAQTVNPATVSGTVAAGARPLAYCGVSLHSREGALVKGSVTDSTGQYQFSKVDTGTYYVEAAMVGYTPLKSELFTISTGKTAYTLPAFSLTAATGNLGNVTVTANKRLFEMEPDKMVMNVENSILAAGNSVFDVLKKAPAVTSDKDDNILLKGARVLIYIDGRPTYMGSEQLSEYLKSMPADAVSKIELITNPSSKYDAAGSTGIINIKLKKNKALGTNGSASLGGGYGKYDKERGSLELNHRNSKINIFGNTYLSHSQSYNLLHYNNVINNNGLITRQARENYWHPDTYWLSYKLGADYSIGRNTILGVLVNHSYEKTKARTDDVTNVADANNLPVSSIDVIRLDTSRNTNTTYNLNFRTTLDTLGSELTGDLDYAHYNSASISVNENYFYNNAKEVIRNPYIFRNNQPAVVNIWSGKLDYTRYFKNKLKLEAGVKYSRVKTDNNLVADSLRTKNWAPDSSRTNHFIYDETISAAYATVSRAFNKTNIQLGVRAENTSSTGNLLTTGRVDKRNYLNLFPTLFITQTLNSNNQLNFSYTRRINRPSYESLNPFVLYIDPYTIMGGNPFLTPSYSNSFEVKHGFKNILFTSFSYRHASKEQVTVILQDKTTGITTNTPGNSGSSDNFRIDITASVQPLKWWTSENNVNVAYSKEHSVIPDFSYNTTSISSSLNSENTFMLPRDFKFQLDGYYGTPSRSGLMRFKSYYGMDASLQKTILHKKASIKFSATNIIGLSSVRIRILSDQLNTTWTNKWEGRRYNLTFTWKFGNSNVKASRSHTTASQAEQNRVNL